MTTPRLKEDYKNRVEPLLEKELGITNINGYYLGGTPDANGYIRDSKGNSLYHATLFEKGSKDGTPVTPPDIFD